MQFDSREDGWTSADDRELRLQSLWRLAVALALIALTMAAVIASPVDGQKPMPAVAGMVP